MQRILLQLDTDAHPSVFDRIVAVDAGAQQVLSYGGVTADNVVPLAHGAIFTRGPADLKNTAIFVGGGDVEAAGRLLKAIRRAFFGPMQVSVLCDPNGSNTTAAAAVRCATKHLDPAQTTAVILGGAGPVGQRVARLLAKQGATVRVASRFIERAAQACDAIRESVPEAKLEPAAFSQGDVAAALEGVQLVVSAGAAGVQFLAEPQWRSRPELRVAIDLNAVPPAGLAGIRTGDRAVARDHVVTYGAIGVGGLKMKVHKAALGRLFEANDQILDTDEIYALATALD
jgi:hypothetical protein